MNKTKATWITALVAGYGVCCAIAFQLNIGLVFPIMGAIFLWSAVVIGVISYLVGSMIVSDDQPNWLRIVVGFFAFMIVGGMLSGLGGVDVDTLRP